MKWYTWRKHNISPRNDFYCSCHWTWMHENCQHRIGKGVIKVHLEILKIQNLIQLQITALYVKCSACIIHRIIFYFSLAWPSVCFQQYNWIFTTSFWEGASDPFLWDDFDQKRKMKDERWRMKDEKCKMKDERWKMKNEKWNMKHETWKIRNERWKMKNEKWIMNN